MCVFIYICVRTCARVCMRAHIIMTVCWHSGMCLQRSRTNKTGLHMTLLLPKMSENERKSKTSARECMLVYVCGMYTG